MTKKGRRASERRNTKDEPTKAARQRSKNEATVVGVDLSQLQTKQGEVLENEEAHASLPDATQESRADGTLSTRFGTQTQSQQMDADQAFRHAVLAVDEEMPETAIGDDISSADKSFLNAELEILSGADADSRFQLEHYPVILGRENEACHIQLQDAAVSQTHLVFDYAELTGRWLISVSEEAPDGALLNGVRLNEQKSLSHGDVIRLGRSELRFFYRRGVPEKRTEEALSEQEVEEHTGSIRAFTGRFFGLKNDGEPDLSQTEAIARPSTRKVLLSRNFLLVCLAVGLLGGGYLLWNLNKEARSLAEKEQIHELLIQAHEDVKSQNLELAKTKIESLLPWVDEVPELKSFQRILKSEEESFSHLAAAKKKYDDGKKQEMKKILAMIPNTSVFADERDKLRAQLHTDEASLLTQKIKANLQKRRFDEAEKELGLYATLWGEDETSKKLNSFLQERRGKAPPDTGRMKKARDLFRQGSHLAALSLFDSSPLNELERQLKTYLQDYKDALFKGSLALKQKSGPQALAAFSKAKTLYRRIARSPKATQLLRMLDQNLANGHYLVGATEYVKNPCKGAEHFWRAYALVPDDRKVKSRIEQMRLKADQVYREANAEAKVNVAASHRKAKAALCLVPQKSDLYQKLKSL